MGEGILEPKQITFLDVFARSDIATHFYLSGGTALAAFYLRHRRSEYLDFFSEHEINPMVIDVFLKSHKKDLGFTHTEYQQSFNRNLFFLHYPDGVLKTEFTYFPFTRIERGMREGALQIDSLRDIAVNKVFTIARQIRARDFIDLFFVLQKESWTIPHLVRDARLKFDSHIDLVHFGAQLLKAEEAKDVPRMLVPFDQAACVAYFIQAAAALMPDVLQ